MTHDHGRRMVLTTATALGLWVLLMSCTSESKPTLIRTQNLSSYALGDVAPLHTLDGVFLAGQPTEADLQQWQQQGLKTVINLRLPSEQKNFDEAQIAEDLGLDYHSPGFDGPEMLSDHNFDRVRQLLTQAQNKPILLHCRSGNRVGTIWLAHRVLDGGLPYEQALVEARTVGLKLPAYESKAKDYIERHRRD